MRISDWSSDVCSSDLRHRHREDRDVLHLGGVDDLLRAILAALGAFLEHHLERDQEQHDSAGDTETVEADAERVEDIVPEQREDDQRSEEHTSELQSLMRISYAVFCLKKKNKQHMRHNTNSCKQD